ncbi:hypothetical protein OF117_15650 [Geodermatophilus sp. YIM 151500]|uniref:PepSY domain-containing protein n=1 Tax=Geodermatophilus sp. YIM 151500 TaxID=2984531 RepID=UPI0021E4B773|nr:hypothetical protein [Geodermatophilus sp. YIM 151500]MCV2490792.1 hypothetical protein [Geodermatophilus sp. YIM 151500]
MRRPTTRLLIITAATTGFASIGTGIAIASALAPDAGESAEAQIQSPAYERAVEAALAHVGAGVISDSEVSTEEGAYEVEVLLDDGTEVEVQLDESFAVVAEEQETPDAD